MAVSRAHSLVHCLPCGFRTSFRRAPRIVANTPRLKRDTEQGCASWDRWIRMPGTSAFVVALGTVRVRLHVPGWSLKPDVPRLLPGRPALAKLLHLRRGPALLRRRPALLLLLLLRPGVNRALLFLHRRRGLRALPERLLSPLRVDRAHALFEQENRCVRACRYYVRRISGLQSASSDA